MARAALPGYANRERGDRVRAPPPPHRTGSRPVTLSALHGYPRIGHDRELKRVTERYWAGRASEEELLATGSELRLAA
ncbi:MAG: hypothetical protein GWO02_12285, partial [Gammaproteobacteria bacterium]|nr:hypothetical protein [Gammaproteobacteria bacterium]